MSSCGSITHLLRQSQAGNEDATRALCVLCYPMAVKLADRKLRGKRSPLADAEDVAQEALASLLMGARDDKFARLANRNDLWQLLALLTVREAVNLIHHVARQKRDEGKTVSH